MTAFSVLAERELDVGLGAGKPLDDTDFENGDKINTSLSDGEDPITQAIENGNGFEGDIQLNKEQADMIRNINKLGSMKQTGYMQENKFDHSSMQFLSNSVQPL